MKDSAKRRDDVDKCPRNHKSEAPQHGDMVNLMEKGKEGKEDKTSYKKDRYTEGGPTDEENEM